MTRKPPSKPRKAPKGPKTPEGSAPSVGGQEGALPAPQQPVHSRAREALPRICKRLEDGTPISHACALERVPRQSFYDLLGSDEDAALDVAKARAHGAEDYREQLVLIAKGCGEEGANANVLLHLMERLYPDDYAPPKQRVGLEGDREAPLELKHSGGIAIDVTSAVRIARQAKESGK
jgi:hypothetical protein